ncbi:fimbrial protein [uncultured Bacteroides sp.]|uniref:fimbrial protein n=1 Tax=uncultured Bacteroides sp. TaxID=162156 RepID=UPI00280BB6C3|nr:fimbrial protein [uncultured Bacteroides sp.]
MKNIRRYLGLTLLILAAIAMSSCIKENFTESLEDDRTTNVYLVLNSRVGEFDDNEDIKTLRLLVIDDNGTINFNRQIKPTSLPNNSVSFTLIGLEMGSGTKNFYVIANEESIGLNAADFESDYAEKKQLKGEWKTILKSLPVDENGVCFYQQASGIVTYGLPITGYTEDFLLKKDQNNLVEIDIILNSATLLQI